LDTNARCDMRGISKRFGDVQALDDVNLSLQSGEVHALLGENGAGKTTLMNILSGLYRADAGNVHLDGQRIKISRPRDAIAHGIGMVHQHFELVRPFTALENIILGQEGKGALINFAADTRKVEELMATYGLTINPGKLIKDLAVGVQQKVEILKALYRSASILILDEPTTMLTPQEVDALFSTIRTLTERGLTVVVITHKIKEVLSVSNRVTVMRRGKVISTLANRDATEALLVELMIGKDTSAMSDLRQGDRPVAALGRAILTTSHLGIHDEKGGWAAREVSIEVRHGELVGLVGVAGNGQREVAEAIFGARESKQGNITLTGHDVTSASIGQRLKLGLSFIPEDRIRQGILPTESVAATLLLGPHNFLFGRSIFLDNRKVRELAKEAIRDYDIRTPDERLATHLLSGGNMQKLIIARALLLSRLVKMSVLVAFNPTRGLDIMSTRFIHQKLLQISEAGGGVLLVSEDLDESLQLCDRIYVMHQGRVVGEFDRQQFQPYTIGALMVGGSARHDTGNIADIDQSP
jgi:general nucleoside transport system ATP-binding protein